MWTVWTFLWFLQSTSWRSCTAAASSTMRFSPRCSTWRCTTPCCTSWRNIPSLQRGSPTTTRCSSHSFTGLRLNICAARTVTFSTLVFADLHHSLGSRPQRTPEEPGHVCTYAAQILQLQIFLLFNVKSDARPRSPLTGSSSGNQVLTFESLRTKQRKVQRKKRFYRSRCTIKNFIPTLYDWQST